MKPELFQLILPSTWESLYMTLISAALAYVAGLPLGILLVVTDKNGIRPMPALNTVLGTIVNLLRSVPFLILFIALRDVTSAIVGKAYGARAVIVALFVAAAPFIARMVESSLKEVDPGVIEASQSMGANTMQIICKVLLPEARASLLVGAAISITTILGYSAMAGIVGGGGLGAVAINYGYYRNETVMMWIMIVILVAIVQVFQEAGLYLSRVVDKRIR
ncbi:MAG: ABC transporter permease [Lachnospiraceae bacterium]|jgi:D-methionine transport system permease protein|nr:ABC transporter permease [Lachnospiraceae bacterium]